jgi:hypothetical protein
MDDPSGPLAAGLGAGLAFLLLYLVLMASVVAFGLWLTYTIIWRAVRRGLREYHYPSKQWISKSR